MAICHLQETGSCSLPKAWIGHYQTMVLGAAIADRDTPQRSRGAGGGTRRGPKITLGNFMKRSSPSILDCERDLVDSSGHI